MDKKVRIQVQKPFQCIAEIASKTRLLAIVDVVRTLLQCEIDSDIIHNIRKLREQFDPGSCLPPTRSRRAGVA